MKSFILLIFLFMDVQSCLNFTELRLELREHLKSCANLTDKTEVGEEEGFNLYLCIYGRLSTAQPFKDAINIPKFREAIISRMIEPEKIPQLEEAFSVSENVDPSGGLKFFKEFLKLFSNICIPQKPTYKERKPKH